MHVCISLHFFTYVVNFFGIIRKVWYIGATRDLGNHNNNGDVQR